MKKILLLLFLAGTADMALAAGAEPGNWKWKHNDGSDATTPSRNMGIVLSHSQDVIRMRMQIYSGTLSTSQANGRVFLQYCDAGFTTSASTSSPTPPTPAGLLSSI